MAKAIEYTPHPPTPAEKLGAATAQAEPALAEALELLTELHQRGGLDLALKLLRGSEGLTAAALDKVTGETGTNVIRNVVELGKLAGSLDPAELQVLLGALSGGVREAARSVEAGERVTPAGALRQLADPDVQLALGAVFGLLRGMGAGLRQRGEQGH
ncbi:hypothetical protein GCM10017783_02820 [Deinococcus piscis]|uniref:DUF1641 domain-containing protein n=1 Tax=Deinococcus piscis TaxID=394230 RepID=A0ABQ3K138_9DEIO|nr:DUF1641 domain-containing protein [Deinococcus piscis]GHF94242.1 hypothetical protein GCM10017783_02820 [Deinococcus piscis]